MTGKLIQASRDDPTSTSNTSKSRWERIHVPPRLKRRWRRQRRKRRRRRR